MVVAPSRSARRMAFSIRFNVVRSLISRLFAFICKAIQSDLNVAAIRAAERTTASEFSSPPTQTSRRSAVGHGTFDPLLTKLSQHLLVDPIHRAAQGEFTQSR